MSRARNDFFQTVTNRPRRPTDRLSAAIASFRTYFFLTTASSRSYKIRVAAVATSATHERIFIYVRFTSCSFATILWRTRASHWTSLELHVLFVRLKEGMSSQSNVHAPQEGSRGFLVPSCLSSYRFIISSPCIRQPQ